MSLRWFTADERPELVERRDHLVATWPAFMLEDPVSHRCWGLLYERFRRGPGMDQAAELGRDDQ